MPVSKRTGKRYTKGSTISYGGWEPKTCAKCGQKVAVTRRTDSYYFSRHGGPKGEPLSRHAHGTACLTRPPP